MYFGHCQTSFFKVSLQQDVLFTSSIIGYWKLGILPMKLCKKLHESEIDIYQ